MYRIAVVGDRDSIYGFATLGIEIFPVDNSEKASQTIKKLINENVGIIYITELIADEIYEELSELTKDSLVSIIPIPGLSGNTGIGIRNVKRAVEKAVGTDILFSENT